MQLSKCILVFSVLSVIVTRSTLAAETLQLAPDKSKYALSSNINVMEDESRKLTIEDVTKPEFGQRFRPAGPKTLSLGMTHSAVWLRFTLVDVPSPSNRLPREWLLDMGGWPYLDHVDLYTPYAENNGQKNGRTVWTVKSAGQLAREVSRDDPLVRCAFSDCPLSCRPRAHSMSASSQRPQSSFQ